MSGYSLPKRVASAFNRHGAFTARVVENDLAVELRQADTGVHLTTIWAPIDGADWTWPPTPNSEALRTCPDGSIEQLVRMVATSVLDEAAVKR